MGSQRVRHDLVTEYRKQESQGTLLCGDLNGKKLKKKKEGIYVYAQLIHFVVQQKVTQQYKATIRCSATATICSNKNI